MSYSIRLIKDETGVRIENSTPPEHIPDGVFVVSGHKATEGSLSTFGAYLSKLPDKNGLSDLVVTVSTSFPGR